MQSVRELQEAQRKDDEREAAFAQQRADFQAVVDKNTAPPPDSVPTAATPRLTVKGGTVRPGTKVAISCATPGSVIYYTTTGWSPTMASRRYAGPIAINGTTLLQAIASAPGRANSQLSRASYTVKGPAVPVFPLALPSDGVLHAKTRLHLVTVTAISSKNAKVGDKVEILLDQDVKIGDAIAIPKGAAVNAAISAVQPSGQAGAPGSISFAVQALTANGITVPLKGGESLEGVGHQVRNGLLFLTLVGSIPAVMGHGGEAEIKLGMKFTVGVAADTPLLSVSPGKS